MTEPNIPTVTTGRVGPPPGWRGGPWREECGYVQTELDGEVIIRAISECMFDDPYMLECVKERAAAFAVTKDPTA